MFWIVQLVDSVKQRATLCLRVQVRIISFVIHEVSAQSFPHKLEIIVTRSATDRDCSGDGGSKGVQRWEDRVLIVVRNRVFSLKSPRNSLGEAVSWHFEARDA